ncbi:MAG: NUDIX hydrolase [Gammaproteobacteria bacterium]|nr:NUDIX hydrolase [Gammaproteobacteria bacterium]
MSEIWKPNTVVAAIIEDNGKFLMVEETSAGNAVFNQPAGHLDEGESLLNAVVRETLEETAWHFEPEAITGIYLWPNPENECTYLRFCFCGKANAHESDRTLDAGIIRAVWMTRDELEKNKARLRSPMVLRTIDDYLLGIRHPLNLISDLF